MSRDTITNLRDAADQLVRAALDDATITKPLGELKESLEGKLSEVNKEIKSLKGELVTIASRIETLRIEMRETLVSEWAKFSSKSTEQDKQRRIEWAMSNCGLKSFKFFTEESRWNQVDSKDLIQDILLWFRRGSGRYIRGMSATEYSGNSGKDEKGEEQFRVKLKDQLAHLLGKEPRVAKEEQGYAIYYS